MSDYVQELYTFVHISKRTSYARADVYLNNKEWVKFTDCHI